MKKKKDVIEKSNIVTIIHFKNGLKTEFIATNVDTTKPCSEWDKKFYDWYYGSKEPDLFLYHHRDGICILNRNEITYVDIKKEGEKK